MCVCIELLQALETEKTDAENAERRKEEEAHIREADEAESKANKLKKAGYQSFCCVPGIVKYKVFSDKPYGYSIPKKETEMRRIGSIIVWDLEKKDTAKAVQCLATSDDTASRVYIKLK